MMCHMYQTQKYRKITESESASFARSVGKKVLWFYTPELAELQVLIRTWFWTRIWAIHVTTAPHIWQQAGVWRGTDGRWSCPRMNLWCPWDVHHCCEHPCVFPIRHRRFRFCVLQEQVVYSEVIYRVEASAKKIKTFLCYFVFLSCNEDLCKDYVELHSGLIQYCNICSSKQWQQQNSYNGPVQITGIFICGFQELGLKTSLSHLLSSLAAGSWTRFSHVWSLVVRCLDFYLLIS